MEDPTMGSDNKPSVNLARQADDDLRKRYAQEKEDQAAGEADPAHKQMSDPPVEHPDTAEKN